MRIPRSHVAVVFAGAFAATLLTAAAFAHGTAQPETLLMTRGPIRAFAQDGGRIAWVGSKWDVRVRTVRTRKTTLIGTARPYGLQAKNGIPPQLALSGARVLWTQSGGGDALETDVYVRKAGGPKARVVGGSEADRYVGVGDGSYFGAMAGAGPTLVFSILFYRCASPDCTELAVPTNFESIFDGNFRVLGTSKRERVPGADGGFEVAASGRRLAVLPAADPIPTGSFPYAAAGTPVDVRDARTGASIAQFTPPGTVRGLALSGSVAAVVDEAQDGTRAIERYDASSGTLLGTTEIAAGDSLALRGSTVVFAVGRKIEAMDAATGSTRVLTTSPGAPIGLSVSGKRLAWAVNVRGRGRVLALTLP